MTRKRKAADYPAEFLEIWELAAKGTLSLKFNEKGQALNFRQRLHAFRRTMIEENGQAAFAHWFTYDLEIVQEPVPYPECKAMWILQTTTLDWKAQVRAQAAAANISAPSVPSKIQNPASTIPEGLGPTNPHPQMWGQTPDGKPCLNNAKPPPSPEENANARRTMEEALSKLGFKS